MIRAALALVLFAPSIALAQELGIDAEVERPIASTGGDPTASATSIETRDRPSEAETLELALREVPGARAISSGSYGSPISISLRGADADQLEVLIDDLPLTTVDGTSFDLSLVPLWALERIEVYRSGAPAWLGAQGMGGVLRLVPRTAREDLEVHASAGLGSFGLFHARAGAEARTRDLAWLTAVGVTSSEGDFSYTDDARTFSEDDDVERSRQNGELREGSGLGHLALHIGDGTLRAFLFANERFGGVPGPASQPTRLAHRNEVNVQAALGYELRDRGRSAERADWRLSITTAGSYRRRRFTDPFGEIGLPSTTDDGQWRSMLRAAAIGRALEWLELTGVALYAHDELDLNDAMSPQPSARSARDTGLAAIEARLHGRVEGVRLELRPSARVSILSSRLTDVRRERAGEASEGLTLAPTFRIAAAIEPVPGIAIAASFASATRAPSMLELFGDRGFLRGDVGLSPERAETIDLGLALRGAHDVLRGSAELRGFATFASDLIRYRRTSQYTAVPENVASAMLFGAELGLHARIDRYFSVAGALTFLETRTEHLGRTRRLPLRPWMTAYVRPAVSGFEIGPVDRVDLWVELAYVSESYVNPANDPGGLLPDRARFGVGISAFLWENRLRLDLEARDVFDQRGTDLLGFPLPGRSFGATLTVRSD